MILTALMAAVLPLNGLWDFHLEADKSLEETAMPAFPREGLIYITRLTKCEKRAYNFCQFLL